MNAHVMECISRAKRLRFLNFMITETFNEALKAAESANGSSDKSLAGKTLVVKDCFSTDGIRTTCGSKMLSNYTAPYTGTVVQRALDSGAVLLGKSNMEEFSMGATGVRSYFGPSKNPWTLVDSTGKHGNFESDWLITGGSSSGSAVAVACGVADIALGSDTGGSVRNPASHCGVVGFKPSYGVLSRYGLIPLVNSMDSPAIMCRTVREVADALGNRICAVVEPLLGKDESDATSVNLESEENFSRVPTLIKNLKIGIPKEYEIPQLDPRIALIWQKAIKKFSDQGAKLSPCTLPHTKYCASVYQVLGFCEIASNMSRNYERYFLQAQKIRRLIWEDFEKVFEDVDVLLTPVTLSPPVWYSQHLCEQEQSSHEYEKETFDDYFTFPANLAGIPAVCVPVATLDGSLPVSLQLMGRPFSDRRILDIAQVFEKMVDFSRAPLESALAQLDL